MDWSKCEVIKTDLDEFLRGGTLEVKEYTEEELDDLYPVEHIVHYARGCLGDAGYNLVINNCEHFANMCTLGRFRSKQVERVFNIILGGGSLPKKRRGLDMLEFEYKSNIALEEAKAKGELYGSNYCSYARKT